MIELVETTAGLEGLAPEWRSLWQATPDGSPFATPEWLLPWWRQFGTDLPRVAVRRQNGRLAGLLPLYVLPAEAKALPIGAGTTDTLGALGECEGLLAAALDRIFRDGITRCDLIDIDPASALIGIDVPGWRSEWRPGTTCPVLALPHIPHGMRRNVALARNRAAREGGYRIETASAATLASFLDTLTQLHESRWHREGAPGVLADPSVRAFWQDAAPSLCASGLLRAQTLHIAGRPMAAIASLLSPGRIHFYLSGVDRSRPTLSPGVLLFAGLIEEAIAEGRREAHFLRGGEAYKYRWGAVDRLNAEGRYRAAPPRL